jgi:hypothetical protein
MFSKVFAFKKPCVRDEDVEPISNQVADLRGKRVGAIRRGEIGGNRIGASASRTDLINHSFGFVGVPAGQDPGRSPERFSSDAPVTPEVQLFCDNLIAMINPQ